MSETLYITGKMRGLPEHNYPMFNEVEAAWLEQNPDDTVLNPARNFGGDKTRKPTEYMFRDLTQVLASDALILLPNWIDSEYGKLEVAVGKATGKKFYQALPVRTAGAVLANERGHDGWQFLPIDEPSAGEPSPRAQSLDRAKSYVCGDRNAAYGSPTQDFARTAAAWTAYGYKGPNGRSLVAHDVALMMVMLKASRLMWSPERRDSWDDIAGYAACGWECVTSELEGIVE